jgi:hypothetical protein
MTARTAFLAANIGSISKDSWATAPTPVAAVAAGMYISCVNGTTGQTIQDPARLMLVAVVGSTATVVTLRATGSGNNVAGVAQVSPVPSSTVFAQSTLGDLVSASTTSGTIGVTLTTDRFLQPDGNIYIDFSQVTGVTVYAWQRSFIAV